jgi:hypothetical protein
MISNQLKLNFEEPSPPSACNLKTKEVSDLIHLVARQKISVDEVRKRLIDGGFTVIYAHGRLRVVASEQRKQGKFLIADVEFLPAIVPQ